MASEVKEGEGAKPADPPPPPYPPHEMWRTRFIDYFAVCGVGLDLRRIDGKRGFHGIKEAGTSARIPYMPTLVDRYPPEDHKKFEVPEMLPVAVLPSGMKFYSKGTTPELEESMPKVYPIILTEGNGTKFYVVALAFRDLIDDDVAQAYSVPSNCYADKCICVVSHWPFLDTFQAILEEIHRLCFQPQGCPRPIWDIIASFMSVPLPPNPSTAIMFNVQDDCYCVTVPDDSVLPSQHVSFRPLVESLDIDSIIQLFTAALLERRVLLLSSRFKLLSLVGEAVVALLWPYKWMLPFIPVLSRSLVEFLHSPVPYIYGINRGTMELDEDELEGVVIVDLDTSTIRIPGYEGEDTDENALPMLPEPELSELRRSLVSLIHPYVTTMESVAHARPLAEETDDNLQVVGEVEWGAAHDERFRLTFIRFLATVLKGYKDFVIEDHFAAGQFVFDRMAFLESRCEQTGMASEPMIDAMLSTQGWHNFFEQEVVQGMEMDKQDSAFDSFMTAFENDLPVALPKPPPITNMITLSEQALNLGLSGRRSTASRLTYIRFPVAEKSAEQEARSQEDVKAMRAWIKERKLGNSRSARERGEALEMHKIDTQVRLCQHFDEFRALPPSTNPMASAQYGTMYGIIESDLEGVGSASFLECLKSNLDHQVWSGELSPPHFAACKELIMVAVARAGERKDYQVAGDLLTIAGRIFFINELGLKDYLRRYISSLAVWQSEELWDELFDGRMQEFGDSASFGNYSHMVMLSLKACAYQMVELGFDDKETWSMLLRLGMANGLREKRQVTLRGAVALFQSRFKYFGPLRTDALLPVGSQSSLIPTMGDGGAPSPRATGLRSQKSRHMIKKSISDEIVGQGVDGDPLHSPLGPISEEGAAEDEQGSKSKKKLKFVMPPAAMKEGAAGEEVGEGGGGGEGAGGPSPSGKKATAEGVSKLKNKALRKWKAVSRIASLSVSGREESSKRAAAGGISAASKGITGALAPEGGGKKGGLERNASSLKRRGGSAALAASWSEDGGLGLGTRSMATFDSDAFSAYPERRTMGKEWSSKALLSRQRAAQGLRDLRGHKGAVTALHVGSAHELPDLLDSCSDEELGYFVSGSIDCTVKLWNPNRIGSEMRATYRGHTGTIRAITSDASRIVSGGDDLRVKLFDKRTTLSLGDLTAHTAPVTCVRTLSGRGRGTLMTAGWDGLGQIWDLRSLLPVVTFCEQGDGPILCSSHCPDNSGLIAVGHASGVVRVWDLTAGKEMHVLEGHQNWVSCVKVTGDVIVSGSHDWTAMVWSVETGEREKTLIGHAGTINDVDYATDMGFVATCSADGTTRLWKKSEETGAYMCEEQAGVFGGDAAIVVRVMDGVAATASTDNTLSFLQHEEIEDPLMMGEGGTNSSWSLLKALTSAPDTVRHVAVDMESGCFCSGTHSGAIRLWDAFPEARMAALHQHRQAALAAANGAEYDIGEIVDNLSFS